MNSKTIYDFLIFLKFQESVHKNESLFWITFIRIKTILLFFSIKSFTRPHLTYHTTNSNLPLLPVNIWEYVECFGTLHFPIDGQYFSPFVIIENGSSGNFSCKQFTMKLCCFFEIFTIMMDRIMTILDWRKTHTKN